MADLSLNNIHVDFSITDLDLDLEIITIATGITPHRTWRLGDPVSWADKMKPGVRVPRRPEGGWEVLSQLNPTAPLDRQLEDIVRQLSPGWDALCRIGMQYTALLLCAVYVMEASTPVITFSNDIIRQFAELNAHVHLDLYCLGPKE